MNCIISGRCVNKMVKNTCNYTQNFLQYTVVLCSIMCNTGIKIYAVNLNEHGIHSNRTLSLTLLQITYNIIIVEMISKK